MNNFADQLINILNDPTHEKHAKIKEIMATEFTNNNSQESYIQITIKRRLEELKQIDAEKQANDYKKMWEDRFNKLKNTDIETDPDNAVTLINEIVSEFVKLNNDKKMYSIVEWIRHNFFTDIIGWAIPSKSTIDIICNTVSEHLKKYPDAKFIDWGCGSGIWSFLFNINGISANNIIAVDNSSFLYEKHYYPRIFEISDFSVNDILFIAWGQDDGPVEKFVENFINNGGKYVILLGESNFGCTFNSHYFRNIEGWKITEFKVDGGQSNIDYLTINRKLD